MTMTALHVPHKELRSESRRAEDGSTAPAWDLYLDGVLIASGYPCQDQAQLELDLAAWYAMFGEAPLVPARPITDEALGLALTVFNRCFTSLKVQEKARIALERIIRPNIYTIQPDGSLRVMASSARGKQTTYAVTSCRMPSAADGDADGEASYQVTMACECRDFYTRVHEHAGICKHIAARLLLFLAQQGVGYLKHLRDALDTAPSAATLPPASPTPPATTSPTDPAAGAPETEALAFVGISGPDLAAALFLADRANTAVELHAACGALHLRAGAIDLTFPCPEGHGRAAVRLEQDAFSALYAQLRPAAKNAGVLHLFVEPSDGSLFLCSQGDETFSAAAQGTPIPVVPAPTPEPAPEPTPEPTPAPAPAAAPQLAEALHELFTLLERYEPDWYLRRHERSARDALRAAGHLAA